MNIEELETKLSKGEQWGFAKQTDDPDFLGWILVSKRSVPPGTILDPTEGERYLRLEKEMRDLEERPYHLKVLELRRDVHERGDYETNEDYRLNENYYYSTLSEAFRKIEELGYSIDSIQHRRILDAP